MDVITQLPGIVFAQTDTNRMCHAESVFLSKMAKVIFIAIPTPF